MAWHRGFISEVECDREKETWLTSDKPTTGGKFLIFFSTYTCIVYWCKNVLHKDLKLTAEAGVWWGACQYEHLLLSTVVCSDDLGASTRTGAAPKHRLVAFHSTRWCQKVGDLASWGPLKLIDMTFRNSAGSWWENIQFFRARRTSKKSLLHPFRVG